MKIFSTFDSKLDEKLLEEAIRKHWKAMIIKRHFIFLIQPLLLSVFSLFLFSILLVLLYVNLDISKFLILGILYILWIWYWIFSTFKNLFSYFRHYNFIITKISSDDFKDWKIEKFLKHSIFVVIYQVIVMIFSAFVIIEFWQFKDFTNYMLVFFQILINILFIYILLKILKKLIDFEMDFTLITNEYITFVNQTWLFKRTSKTIDLEKIKTISVNKKWILRSLLNFGEIIIFTEGDDQHGELKIKYIPEPEKVKNKIMEILKNRKE